MLNSQDLLKEDSKPKAMLSESRDKICISGIAIERSRYIPRFSLASNHIGRVSKPKNPNDSPN